MLSGGRVVAVDRIGAALGRAPARSPRPTGAAPGSSASTATAACAGSSARARSSRSRSASASTGEHVAGSPRWAAASPASASRTGSPSPTARRDALRDGPLSRRSPAGGGRAALGGDPLRVFDVAKKTVTAFTVPDRASFVAVTARGQLFVATPEAIWAEDDRGDLRLRFEAAGMTIHGLAAAAERVWFADGRRARRDRGRPRARDRGRKGEPRRRAHGLALGRRLDAHRRRARALRRRGRGRARLGRDDRARLPPLLRDLPPRRRRGGHLPRHQRVVGEAPRQRSARACSSIAPCRRPAVPRWRPPIAKPSAPGSTTAAEEVDAGARGTDSTALLHRPFLLEEKRACTPS